VKKYFYTDGVSKFGPYTLEELLQNGISRDTKIWFFGLSTWTPLNEIVELNQFVNKLPPAIKQPSIIIPPPITEITPSIKHETNRKPTIWKEAIIVAIFVVVIFSLWLAFRKSEPKSKDVYEEIVNRSFDSDEEFEMYLDKFYRDLGVFGIYPSKPNKRIIKFSNLEEIADATHIHGVSFGHNNDEVIEIYINPSSWKKFNRAQKYFLMYHELSHDILNLDDLEVDEANKGRLMFPNIESYDKISMDEFIESYQKVFEEVAAEKAMIGE
jgi:hypothetical protein